MSLAEKLKKKQCNSKVVEVDGLQFKVTGLSMLARGEAVAAARNKKGSLDTHLLDRILLERCVADAEDGSTMTADEWAGVPSHIGKALLTVVFELVDASEVDPKG